MDSAQRETRLFERLERLETELIQQRRQRRRGRLWLALALGTGLLIWAGGALSDPAVSLDCDDAQTDALYCFNQNTPARANHVNSNFAQLVDWLEQKVGMVGDENVVVTGNLDVDGSATVHGGLSVDGSAALSGGLSAGNLIVPADASSDEINIDGPVEIAGPVNAFGALQGKSGFERHTAPTDGLVFSYMYSSTYGHHLRLQGYVGTPTLPSELNEGSLASYLKTRASVRNEAGDTAASIVFPVEKGQQWLVGAYSSYLTNVAWSAVFLPLGNDQ